MRDGQQSPTRLFPAATHRHHTPRVCTCVAGHIIMQPDRLGRSAPAARRGACIESCWALAPAPSHLRPPTQAHLRIACPASQCSPCQPVLAHRTAPNTPLPSPPAHHTHLRCGPSEEAMARLTSRMLHPRASASSSSAEQNWLKSRRRLCTCSNRRVMRVFGWFGYCPSTWKGPDGLLWLPATWETRPSRPSQQDPLPAATCVN